jgi:hypothetical protein
MFRKAEYLDALEAAILIRHKCKPTHRETIFVREEAGEKETVWEGYVDVFEFAGHKEAKTCFAWQHTDGKGGVKIFAVLENQFINSAKRAVQAALFMDAQPPLCQHSKDSELFKQQLEEFKKTLRGIEAKTEGLESSTPAPRGIRESNRPRPNPEG